MKTKNYNKIGRNVLIILNVLFFVTYWINMMNEMDDSSILSFIETFTFLQFVIFFGVSIVEWIFIKFKKIYALLPLELIKIGSIGFINAYYIMHSGLFNIDWLTYGNMWSFNSHVVTCILFLIGVLITLISFISILTITIQYEMDDGYNVKFKKI